MRLVLTIAVLGLGLLASSSVSAWSAFGHRLVAQLAYAQLSDPVRAEVDALLALEPDADIATIAPWPDEIRSNPGYEHTGPFHYVNFPSGTCSYQASRDCRDGACIIAALPQYVARLGDAGLPASQRLEALKFVVHLVGDAHQPLHAGNRPDRGGNRFQVRVGDEGSNLHAVWDYHVLKYADLGLKAYGERLAPRVAATSPGSLDIEDWAEASCALLDQENLYPARPGKLPKGYLERTNPIAEQQIVLAATRLAATLESTLGGSAASASTQR